MRVRVGWGVIVGVTGVRVNVGQGVGFRVGVVFDVGQGVRLSVGVGLI